MNNIELKSNIAILLSIIAIVSLFYKGNNNNNKIDGPEQYIKQIAKDNGIKGRTYNKCILESEIADLVEQDINETNAIAQFGELSIGTPFNLIITDTQVIPVPGAYPYEFFSNIIQEINNNGEVSKDVLEQFEISQLDYEITKSFEPFDPKKDHYRGSENPSITIIEYSDFECPYCAQIHQTLEKLTKEYENLNWVYRHLPLEIHPQAMLAAISSECIAREEDNTAFWKFTDTIFENQNKLRK